MKILYNWLKEHVDTSATPAELKERLSMAGLAVDAIEDTPAGPLLDLDLTTNRADCLGHYGIAREVAALDRTRPKPPSAKLKESAATVAQATRVDIQCPDLCGRFTARVVRGVRVGPSPDWLQQRLTALGHTPINNIVDATNYVMFELGHPLHAFDMDTLAEQRIVVRRPRTSESIRTLDDVDRALSTDMCLVCDAQRPVGIGGVMGGAATEISAFTKNVLLECAWFDPISIRRTSKALGLRTEASIRFERGMDPEMAELASRRCAELILQIAGGELLAGVVDVYPRKPQAEKIELTRKELLRVMGADVPDRDLEAILAALGFQPIRADATRGSAGSLMASWDCRRPSWRNDVSREIDLVEEVARHYGFDKFPARLPAAKQPAARLPYAEADDRIRELLIGLGYQEIVSIPHVDAAHDALFRDPGITPVGLTNPIAEDASVLRSSGAVSMAAAIEWNLNRSQRNLRLFEIGRRYSWPTSNGAMKAAPLETRILTLGATGLAREQGVSERARDFSFADLKGDLERLGELVRGLTWAPASLPWLDPAHSALVILSEAKDPSAGAAIGWAGHLARRVADRFKLRQDVFLAELALDPLCSGHRATRARLHFTPLPRFPAVERDFSLVLADGTSFEQVAGVIRSLAIPELERVEAVDLFRGQHIPSGKFSLLVRVTFRSHTATLTLPQVEDFSTRIVRALEQQLSAVLRSS